jgi:hypothetical protein
MVDAGVHGARACARTAPKTALQIDDLAARRPNLEDQLRAVYATPCAGCGQMIQPQGFIWEQAGSQPVGRVYQCPFCGDEGEREVTESDLQNLNSLGGLGLHRARALQRVLQGGTMNRLPLKPPWIAICRAPCTVA